MKKITLVFCFLLSFLSGCSELDQVVKQLPEGFNLPNASSAQLSDQYIASGLREALNQGIETQVSKLTQKDGFFKNELVKILLPEELKKVDSGLRSIGLSSCLLYTSPSPRDQRGSRMPSSA